MDSPSTQASNLNDPVIAQQAKNLTKAIFQHESKMNYNAVGDAGTSHGAGQWQAPTWKAQAQDILGDANAAMTPDNQSVVAQGTIRKLISQGKNAAQIAAIWNSGSDTGWENKVGTTTINGQQIHYNVPQYVKDVTDLYQQNKAQSGSAGGLTPVAQASEGTPTPQPQHNDLLNNPVTRGIESIFPGKKTGEAIGTLGGLALEKLKGVFGGQDNSKYYDTSAPTPLQVGGDIAQGALMVGAGLPEAGATSLAGKAALGGARGLPNAVSALGRIGTTAALGGAFGVTGALAQGSTDVKDIATQTGVGALSGGALGGAGELISKISSTLPTRLVQGAIKNSNPDVANYALTKKMGSPTSMYAESNSALKTIGSQLGDALTHSNVADVVIPSEQIVPKVLEQFPNAELSPEVLQVELNKIAPLQKGLITKLFSGQGLTIDELHSLNSAIGQNTYKTVFDDPAVKAGKAIGNAFYQASKDIITMAAPDTTPLFEQYSKEKALNTALYKRVRIGSKTQALTLRDIMSMIGGFSVLGPVGALGALAADRIATSPTANLKTAGVLNKIAGPTVKQAVRGTLPTLLRNTPNH